MVFVFVVKNLPAKQETQVQSLHWEDLLEMRSSKEDGNPHQYSCLRNPMDRGAWQTIVPRGHKRAGHNLATEQQQKEE